jgi:crotonobetainyl-CoA:carnitine CoA-transferase CaiB-like acyl-CoA transferase
MGSTEKSGPLRGVRVLELASLVAGPMATMLLGDFGAEVIKVEDPRRGDELRGWGYAKNNVGLFFKVVNRNKKLITCDLRTAAGQDMIRRLTAKCDVVVEAFRPGRLDAWGIGYEALSAINPSVIMASVSGYGQTGPYAVRPGFGTVVEAASGYAYVTGEADGAPLLPAVPLGDSAAAIYAAWGVTLALYHRAANGGTGQHIDLALYEALFNLLGPQFVNYDQLGLVQERSGSRMPMVAPRNTYRTADGYWIAIAGSTQSTFRRMAHALGIGHLVDDPRFKDNRDRMANVAELDAAIQEAVGRLDRDHVLSTLNEAAAAVGPVNNVQDIFADPHFQARGNVAHVADPDLTEIRMQNVIPRLSQTPGSIAHAGGAKAQDNASVYRELLALTEAELADLAKAGVI